MKKRVADIIMETLVELRISQAFCVVGGGSMFLNNALRNCKEIRTIHNHHEQACAIACEGYARAHRKVAVCCVTTGPGGTNTLTGLVGAYQDSIPMMVIAGQVRYATTVAESGLNLRRRGEQEFDIVNSVQNTTKYAKMIIDPLSIKQEIYKAYDIATHGRPGPVWLDIPLDVQNAMIDTGDLYPIEPALPILECSDEDFTTVIELLKNAKSPCILAGSAIPSCNLNEVFEQFLEKVQIPTVAGATLANVLYNNHPLFFGSTGSVGTRTGNFILQNADVLLVLGCSLGFKQTTFYQETFASNAKIIMIDLSQDEMKKKGLNIDVKIHCDIRSFLQKSIEKQVEIAPVAPWLQHCTMLKNTFSIAEFALGKDDEPVDAYNFWQKYNELDAEKSITVVGNSSSICPKVQFGVSTKQQICFTNINCGAMGYDLPAALGASVKGATVLVTGDGSFMMNLQELQTVVFNKLPVKIVLFANNGYGALMQTYKNYFNGEAFGGSPESGLSMPNFEKIAYAFGLPYKKCKTNGELSDALNWLFSHDGFCFLEICQKQDNPLMPVAKSRLNTDGTSMPVYLDDMYPFLSAEEKQRCAYTKGESSC